MLFTWFTMEPHLSDFQQIICRGNRYSLSFILYEANLQKINQDNLCVWMSPIHYKYLVLYIWEVVFSWSWWQRHTLFLYMLSCIHIPHIAWFKHLLGFRCCTCISPRHIHVKVLKCCTNKTKVIVSLLQQNIQQLRARKWHHRT